MSNMARNYHAHGGAEWVVGGKLTFLPGAVVEGGEGLFDQMPGSALGQIPYLEDSKATSASALREDYNRLLAVLRACGIMAAKTEQPIADAAAGGDTE